jgi:2-polyprenyl-3-methyl-5-hydroxy-6-metoxy-1,4-benzoquinol methylase
MSHEQFIQELNKTYKTSQPEQLEGLALQHYLFASSTNGRGLKVIESMEKRIGFDFRGTRMLDIGCAYGGFCIEAARKGAIAYGIDINQRLIELAKINAQDERVDGEIHLSVVDATSIDLPKLLPTDFFDLVVVNDVFEHVYDTAKLLENISRITANNGTLYFRIPNGLCTRFIRREGHRWVAGISVMDPSHWHHRVKRHFSIYYRRWEYYVALLSYYRFGDIRLLNFGKTFVHDRAKLVKHLQAEFEDIKDAISADLEHETSIAQSYKEALSGKIMEVQKEMQEDLNSLSDTELCWKYLTAFWEGIAVKRSANRVQRESGLAERDRAELVGLRKTAMIEKRKLQAIRNSFSFQLGNMLVKAAYKPGRNTVLLPYRLTRICCEEFKKRKTRAAESAVETKIVKEYIPKQEYSKQKNKARSDKYTEIRLADVMLSDHTAMIKKRYIDRFGVDKGHLGLYKENDWRRFKYVSSLLPDGESVLDIGIASGAFLNLLMSLNRFERILGIDIRRHSKFTMLFESHLYQIVYASVTNLPFADKSIDVVTCMEVLEHLDKQSFMAALHELRRVSRFLVVTVPYNEPEPRPSYHKLRFTDSDLLTHFPQGDFILLKKSTGADWMTIVERS